LCGNSVINRQEEQQESSCLRDSGKKSDGEQEGESDRAHDDCTSRELRDISLVTRLFIAESDPQQQLRHFRAARPGDPAWMMENIHIFFSLLARMIIPNSFYSSRCGNVRDD
jgi:hypothetical protein